VRLGFEEPFQQWLRLGRFPGPDELDGAVQIHDRFVKEDSRRGCAHCQAEMGSA
jgi:hypothetical protein